MIEGMKILLERMKMHPEEFIDKKFGGLPSKWSNLVDRYRHVLTDEEIEAYQQAYKELQRQHFTAHVLETLLDDSHATDSFVYTTAGREIWNTSRLELEKAQEDRYKELLKLQIAEARKQIKL